MRKPQLEPAEIFIMIGTGLIVFATITPAIYSLNSPRIYLIGLGTFCGIFGTWLASEKFRKGIEKLEEMLAP